MVLVLGYSAGTCKEKLPQEGFGDTPGQRPGETKAHHVKASGNLTLGMGGSQNMWCFFWVASKRSARI